MSKLLSLQRHLVHLPKYLSLTAKVRLASSKSGNDYNYNDVVKNFEWKVPEKWNFAQDVIDKWAETNPGNLAFFHVGKDNSTNTQWSYQDLSAHSKSCASGLASLGPMNRAITILPKVPEWWTLNLAAMRTGMVLLPGTTLLTTSDIAARIKKAESDSFIGDFETALKFEAINQTEIKDLVKHKILVLTAEHEATQESRASEKMLVDQHGWVPLQDLTEANKHIECPVQDSSASDIIQIYFTSGTTGEPKMVPHTQGSYGYCHWVTGKYWLDLTPSDLHWNMSDTGWAKSAWSSVFAPWSQGAAVFVHGTFGQRYYKSEEYLAENEKEEKSQDPTRRSMSRFSVNDVLRTLASNPITTMCAPPTLYRSLVQEDLGSYSFDTLRHCVSAGEPLNEEVIYSWEESTGILIKEGYGQTETTLLCATFKGMPVRPGSMGKPAPGHDIRIVNNMGQEVPRGEQGNIGLNCRPHKPPGLFKNYIGDPARTNYAFSGDYYLTGDRARMDKDGYIWFAAREDDIIISAGYRIGPFEVESALIEHPAVAESAVVPSPDVKRGQVVKAFVVLTPQYQNSAKTPEGTDTLIKELKEFVKSKTAPYKYPRRIQFVESLPKTVSGKIKRAELRNNEKKLVSAS